ncbi:polysaccharide deacetylase family protein [Paenibacillus sp. CAA11]|uniref:polysaccharide deacetylase family protein n=1 Tax=Paenibacillus sp. CAA11 TaxID=1532905 RepID=UPI000D3C444E|nr:polysaccharide deacetylase family protein [Paenibacillus sp. CAA11]AWB45661.1 polysaccharide deacetylase family protein [Paenibacillus sp. CAA11]
METLLLWGFYILSLYAFIPGLISRLFGFRVFRRGTTENEFALTFDDGPDAVYTPQLLDLLKKYDAKATFFVVGANAEKHPDLIKRIHDEGHMLGIHNYIHKTNWLMRPGTVKKQVAMTGQIIKSVTGMETHFYRPPWGIVNLFDFSKRNEMQLVLWSSMFGDWRARVGRERLARRMLKKLRAGEVFLLHDCGATLGANQTAPAEMLAALEQVLQEAEARGLRSIRIDEMIHGTAKAQMPKAVKKGKDGVPALSWFKKAIVFLWLLWEKLFHFMFSLQTTNKENPIFHFRVRTYSGDPVALKQGGALRKGDQILELHFDNKRLFDIGSKSKSSVHLAIQLIRNVEKTLPELAQYITKHPALKNVKALYGVSLINRGPEQFGFTVTDLPDGFFAKSTKVYLKLLMRVIHPAGQDRVRRHADQMVPKLIVMPIDTLIEQFGEDGSHRRLQDHKEHDAAIEASIPC